MTFLRQPLSCLILLVCWWLVTGCQSNPQRPTVVQHNGQALPSVALLRKAFLDEPDVAARYLRLSELEAQALALFSDEPLRMGSIGSAILEIYPASYTGHLVLEKFYRNLESTDEQNLHQAWLQHLDNTVTASGEGSADDPYIVMGINDAKVFLRQQTLTEVGAIYQNTSATPLGLTVLARKDKQQPIVSKSFDLSHLLAPLSKDLAGGQLIQPNNPWPVLREFASGQDSAAQAAIGAYLAKQNRFPSAISWLEASARPGNLLAHSLLARIYWFQANAKKSDKSAIPNNGSATAPTTDEYKQLALTHHLQAVSLGSTESMYSLGRLYIEGYYGNGNSAEGIALLEQAGQLGSAESLLYLGHQFRTGQHLAPDPSVAQRYLEQAASLQNPKAIISYARFLTTTTGQQNIVAHNDLLPWLLELAGANNAEAMVVLGNFNARGISVAQSTKKALRWYKKAVRNAGSHHHGAAEIINEVSWTLATTAMDELRNSRYAQDIMNRLMETDKGARDRPEYLDTWANTYAANGDFETAIEVQQRAIKKAQEQQRNDVLKVLKRHLAQFQAGNRVIDQVP
jgi:TPR repeat protein